MTIQNRKHSLLRAELPTTRPLRVLRGLRVFSLALNLPGPAALMRCREMGATCVKLEPPAPATHAGDAPADATGDPMSQYSPVAYAALHVGIRVVSADLKTEAGQKVLHRELAKADVLMTSFRPSALIKLQLDWKSLHKRYPALSQVAIVGASGKRAEEPGHDVTYQAEHDLITGLDLPATLYADMGGSLMASEAVVKLALHKLSSTVSRGVYCEIALADAAACLALPRAWGLTAAGAAVGGGHAGYQIYPCQDGRVAVAALEPHFAARLCTAAGIENADGKALLNSASHHAVASFFLGMTCCQINRLAQAQDIPLHTLLKT